MFKVSRYALSRTLLRRFTHLRCRGISPSSSTFTVALINTPSYSVQSDTGSHSNIAEKHVQLMLLVCFLLAKGFAPAQIMVICLYRDQKLCYASQTDVTVSTVDSAQGKENSVIILCTTRTEVEPTAAASFFSDARRLNVALSRAKDGMFILGFLPCLRKAAVWNRV
ncbi:hypothetical protein OSTOST_25738, partial [Ostertagia ostertagi]